MSKNKVLLRKNSLVCSAVLTALSSIPLYAAENTAESDVKADTNTEQVERIAYVLLM